MMEITPDSQRAWELLVEWLKRLQSAQDASDKADAQAWYEYRKKCDAYDKALTAIKLNITTLKLQIETARIKSTRTPTWQKVAWAIGTAAGATILTRLGVDVPAIIHYLTSQ